MAAYVFFIQAWEKWFLIRTDQWISPSSGVAKEKVRSKVIFIEVSHCRHFSSKLWVMMESLGPGLIEL